VWRFDENKLEQRQSDGVRFATGLRSIVGITWNKKQDNLYAVNHGRDYLHNHAPDYYSKWENSVLPSEEFMLIKKDDDFGWPYTYYDHFKSKRMLAPEYGGDGKQEAKGYAEPIMGLPAHWAPNDLLFYTGSQFPDRYKDGAFIAFHGSTNRGPYPQAGYIVAFIPFKDGRPAGNLEVFADGFTQTDLVKQMKDSMYRPMGLAQGPDGSLYISESKNGKIWRVIFNGDRLNFDNEALKQMESLKQKSYLRIPDKELDLLPIK
jgi:glucose/arabinose dehydrogenase